MPGRAGAFLSIKHPSPLPPEVPVEAHQGGGAPGEAGGDPDAPAADGADAGEDVGIDHAADDLRNAIDHGKGGVPATVENGPGHIDHAQGEIEQAVDLQSPCADGNDLRLLDEDADDLGAEAVGNGQQQKAEAQCQIHGSSRWAPTFCPAKVVRAVLKEL